MAGLGLIAVTGGIVMVTGGSPPAQHTGAGSITWFLAVISRAATQAYLVAFTSLHLLPPGYSPIRHAVSDYAVGRYGPLFRAGLYVSSLAVLALAFALMRGVGSPPLAARDLLYLLLIPVTRIGMSVFPTQPGGPATHPVRCPALHFRDRCVHLDIPGHLRDDLDAAQREPDGMA